MSNETPSKIEISRFGEDGIRIIFGKTIDLEVHQKVRDFYFYFKSLNILGIIDIIPSFCSCLIQFDTAKTNYFHLSALLEEKGDEALRPDSISPPSMHEIPVRYGGPDALDMQIVCEQTGLGEQEVIAIHTESVYTVYAVGFLPGFPYMGPLDARIQVPRLETPRTKVPAGSVGIAQAQTGVYSYSSPGGWRIIGVTDVRFFNPAKEPYSLLQIGDKVRFVSS